MRTPLTFRACTLLFSLALAIAAGLAAARPAHAVEQTGEILGTVLDEKGQPLPGTTLTLKGENLQGERAAVSGPKGEFAFRVLPPGSYTLKISAAGYQVIEHDNIVVNIGRTTTIPVSLTQGSLTETVTVTGELPLVDRLRNTTQENYGPDYLEQVQVGSGGRDYLSVLANTAGTGPGDGANPTVRGSTIGGNVYLIDGVDSTDPVTETFGTNYIYDAIKEIQFQTGGFNAEFGRATGGIANVVTKSGGNVFSGSIDGRYRNQNFYQNGDHFDKDQFTLTNETFEGTLGGPIVKDKLWFFVAGSYIKSDYAGQGFEATRSFTGTYYLAKLTWQAAANHKFVLQTTGDPATIDNVDAGPLTAKEASTKQTQGSDFWTLRYEGVLSPNLILNAQAAYYEAPLDAVPQSGDYATKGWVDYFTGRVSRNAINAQYSDRYRSQADVTLTWNKQGWAGDHTFKAGVDAQALKFNWESLTPGGEYDDVCFPPQCPGPVTILFYNVDRPVGEVQNTGDIRGYFVQDEWRVHPQVTLNLGFRYDTFDYDDDLGRSVFSSGLLQPRAGIAWDITGDARNVVKAYGGRYSDTSLVSLPTVVNSRANATDVYANETMFGDLNGDGTIEERAFWYTFGGPGGSAFANGGKLDTTSVVEYQLSYERQLGASSAAGITAVRRKTYDIIEDTYDQTTGVYIIDNLPGLDRNYYGVELRYRTQWKKLYLESSYTWAKSRGNIGYTQSLGSDFDFPALSWNRYGYLSDDTRHALRFNGYYRLPLDFQISYAWNWISGYPWTPFRPAQPEAPYGNIFLEARGSERLPRYNQLDLDFRKTFNLGGDMSLEAVFTVLNVFDTEIVTSVNGQVPQAGQALTWQTPRRFEFGARFAF